MFNEDMELTASSKGHYAINIFPDKTCNFNHIEQVLVFEEDETDIQKIVKLHKQFGHASSRNLGNLLKRAGMPLSNVSDIINKVVSHCKAFQQYKKAFPRLTVVLPKANYYNDTVAMGLHQLGPNLWYLHFTDKFSRFSNVIIKSKSTNIIIKIFLKYWVSLFGSPNTVFSNNGGEFVSKEFIDFCGNFNMKVQQQQQQKLLGVFVNVTAPL